MITEDIDEIVELCDGYHVGDSLLCHDKADAKKMINQLGTRHVTDWDLLPDGKVILYFDCSLSSIKLRKKKQKEHIRKYYEEKEKEEAKDEKKN